MNLHEFNHHDMLLKCMLCYVARVCCMIGDVDPCHGKVSGVNVHHVIANQSLI